VRRAVLGLERRLKDNLSARIKARRRRTRFRKRRVCTIAPAL
jgi:hypothetical protein